MAPPGELRGKGGMAYLQCKKLCDPCWALRKWSISLEALYKWHVYFHFTLLTSLSTESQNLNAEVPKIRSDMMLWNAVIDLFVLLHALQTRRCAYKSSKLLRIHTAYTSRCAARNYCFQCSAGRYLQFSVVIWPRSGFICHYAIGHMCFIVFLGLCMCV